MPIVLTEIKSTGHVSLHSDFFEKLFDRCFILYIQTFFASIMITIKDIGQTVYISGNLSVVQLHVINTICKLACTSISVKWLELKIF